MSGGLGPETVALRTEGVLSEEIAGETILLDPASGRYARLNATGSRIWRQLESKSSAEELAASLADAADVGRDQALDDVLQFLEALDGRGLVRLENQAP